MIKIDLISGFLGAGKTTFIREYVKYHMEKGVRVCILENDFGAVNVDMLMLNDLYEQGCGLEMLAGACDPDCHKRRLRTKLIAMRMLGYQRVIVEPSGIYDTEEFFDVLREEPLDEWYAIDNVITLVDAGIAPNLSEESEYLLVTQLLSAGRVVLSKTDQNDQQTQERTIEYMNQLLEKHRCELRLQPDSLVGRDYRDEFADLEKCGYRTETAQKLWFDQRKAYDSLYYMNNQLKKEELIQAIQHIFADQACGNVVRIKGFMKTTDEEFVQVNVTEKEFVVENIANGQEVIIVIGEKLNRNLINSYMGKEADTL